MSCLERALPTGLTTNVLTEAGVWTSHSQEKAREEMTGLWPPRAQGRGLGQNLPSRPSEKTNLLTPPSQTRGPQARERLHCCCRSRLVCGILTQRPQQVHPPGYGRAR